MDKTGLIQRSFLERLSLHGICPVFRLSFSGLYLLLNMETQSLANFKQSVVPAQTGDILELNELCSFVGSKANNHWIWVAPNRTNRQIVAYVIGDRNS